MNMVINPGFREYKFHGETWVDEYYAYRENWVKLPELGITSEYPLHIDIETTNRCNLACPFCVREYMDEGVGDFPEWMFNKILMEIQPGKVKSMKFNWRGEPTLFPNLPYFIHMAKNSGIIETAINTNGTRLDEKMAKSLIEAGLDRIIFSIDSIDPEVYRKQRVGAELETVLDNLYILLMLREEMEMERPYIRVQKIDMPETRSENYVGFFQEMGVDSVAINSLKQKDPEKLGAWTAIQCAQPFQRMLVSFKGDMYPCCQGNLFKSVGNIASVTIKEAWHSPTMNYLRDMHHANRQGEIPQCAKCETTKPGEKDGREGEDSTKKDGVRS